MDTPLSNSEVHVLCADPNALNDDSSYAKARSIITASENERLERFAFARDRILFLATRILVRTALSQYVSLRPEEWRFRVSEYGRPEIENPVKPLRFNLSNTAGLVVCAITTDRDVGVDAEDTERPAPLEIVDLVLSPLEAVAFRELPLAMRAQRLFQYWTLKESYIKARGLGLNLPLTKIEFSIDPDNAPTVHIDPELEDSATSWQFMQFWPTKRHIVSVCVRRVDDGDTPMTVRWHSLTNW